MADVLSEVLAGLKIRGSVFCHGEVRAPWCLAGGAPDVCLFHAVVAGRAVATAGDQEIELVAGDLMLLTRGRAHIVASDTDLEPVPLGQAVEADASGFARIVSDGDGEATKLICGTFAVSGMRWHPLLASLPDVLVVSTHTRWLHGTLEALDAQINSQALGATLVADRLAEILFIQTLSSWLEGADHAWVRGLTDSNIGRALIAMHTSPGQAWTTAALARVAGQSRAAFYRRFSELLDEPPGAYLRRWRMSLAARWLEEDVRSIREISAELGYSGVPAFSRAFKDRFGEPPSGYRVRTGRKLPNGPSVGS